MDNIITEYLIENRDYYEDITTIKDVCEDVCANTGASFESVFKLLQDEAQSFGLTIDLDTNYYEWIEKEEELQ